jgi:hypothetical protein
MGIYAFIMWCRSDNEWPFTNLIAERAFTGYADVVYVGHDSLENYT